MQTVETLNEGLKRAYTLKITAQDIDAKVEAEVKRVAPQVRMPGFRPGKVPANLVRKMHGEALAADALNNSIQEGVQQLIAQNSLRPAMAPSVSLEGEYAPGKDAEVKVELEVLPEVPTPSIEGLKLEKLTVPADDKAIDEQIEQLASNQKSWSEAPEGKVAAEGDRLTIDFSGSVKGKKFEGGTGTDMVIELGSGRLIPGFEDQLIGTKLGEEKVLEVTFPADYPEKTLAGKPAQFEIKVNKIEVAGEAKIDDDFAKNLGLQDLAQLKDLLKGQIEQQHAGLTRTYMKRKLLDQLAAGHDFPVPPSMVEAEFDQIWQQLQHETEHEEDPEAAKAELESERDQYRLIAERRVRLGLLLSEIGQANGVEVSQQEMNRLIAQAAQQYGPEDRQRFIQYIQQEPMAAAQLRAPLYEDKVVEFLFEKAEVSEREVTREELEAAIESEEGALPHVHGPDCGHDHHGHDHDHAPKKKAKKAAAADAEAPAAELEPAVEAEPVKKAATKKAPSKADKPVEAPADELVEAEPVKKAATKKAATPKAEGEAEAAPKKKAPAKKKAED